MRSGAGACLAAGSPAFSPSDFAAGPFCGATEGLFREPLLDRAARAAAGLPPAGRCVLAKLGCAIDAASTAIAQRRRGLRFTIRLAAVTASPARVTAWNAPRRATTFQESMSARPA